MTSSLEATTNAKMESSTVPDTLTASDFAIECIDLSDMPAVEKILTGTADIHLKQHLYRQKYASRDLNGKSDSEATKWRKQAEDELRRDGGVDGINPKSAYRALICYNLALANANPNVAPVEVDQDGPELKPNVCLKESHGTSSSSAGECELARAYLGRGLVFLKHLSSTEQGILDLERAITSSTCPLSSKRIHFLLLDAFMKKATMVANCSRALDLVTVIQSKFGPTLSEAQSSTIEAFRQTLEHQLALKSFNTLNYSQTTVSQSLAKTRMPTLVAKDQPLVEALIDVDPSEAYPPMAALANSVDVSQEDRLVRAKDSTIDQSRLVLLEKAFAHVNISTVASFSICASCLVPLYFAGPIPCGTCSKALYCSPACLSTHWDSIHQYECATEERRSTWNRLDALSRLSLRLLLRFGHSWRLMVDFTREFLTDKSGRYNLANKAPFDGKKNVQYRALLDWFLEQGPGGEAMKVSMGAFLKMLGQGYGVFELIQEVKNPARDPIILPEYRAKLLHGILLTRIILESALAVGIVAPLRLDGLLSEKVHLGPFSVRERVAKLLQEDPATTDGDTSMGNKVFQGLLELEEGDSEGRDWLEAGKEAAKEVPLGLALYTGGVFLKRDNSQPEVAPNGTVVYSGVYRGIRLLRPVARGTAIRVALPKEEGCLEETGSGFDGELVEILAKDWANAQEKRTDESADVLNPKGPTAQEKEALDSELAIFQGLATTVKSPRPLGLQLALLLDQSRLTEAKGDFKSSVALMGKTLELTKELATKSSAGARVAKLRQSLMARLCKLQFELFTEKDLSAKESITLADNCLINCSQLVVQLERTCLPLGVYQTLLDVKKKKASTGGELSEAQLNMEGVPSLMELEEMMVAANMFSQKFQADLSAKPAGAAS